MAGLSKPNIIIIYYDDLGYGDLGCYSPSCVAKTPHTDALAASGRRYTDAHSAASVCTPSRYSLLTGRYCWRTWLKRSVTDGYGPSVFTPGEATLPSYLSGLGYKTAMIGKWHLGFGNGEGRFTESSPVFPERTVENWAIASDNSPNTNGFHYSYVMSASLDFPPYMYIENGLATEATSAHAEGYDEDGGVFMREGEATQGFDEVDVEPHFVAKVIDYIEAHSREGSERPFFLQYSSTGPHSPVVPTKENVSEAGDIYTAFLRQLDASVGRIVAALERTGLRDDTILILSTDHGGRDWGYEAISGHKVNGSLRGEKAMLYEGGHRVPFIISWPGKVDIGVSDHLVVQTDLFATLADIIGSPLPDRVAMDGFSFAKDLVGGTTQSRSTRRTAVHHSFVGTFAYRSGPWKLILDDQSGGFDGVYPELEMGGVPSPDKSGWRLFNLETDPGETQDVRQENTDVFDRLVEEFELVRRSEGELVLA